MHSFSDLVTISLFGLGVLTISFALWGIATAWLKRKSLLYTVCNLIYYYTYKLVLVEICSIFDCHILRLIMFMIILYLCCVVIRLVTAGFGKTVFFF